MDRRQWVENVRNELAGQRLPRAYGERLLGELADHAEDWEAADGRAGIAGPTIEEALGTPAEVARIAAGKYRKTRFAGRHPVLVFVIAPLPLIFAIEILIAFGCSQLYNLVVGDDPYFRAGVTLMQTFRFALLLVPLLTTSLLFFWL